MRSDWRVIAFLPFALALACASPTSTPADQLDDVHICQDICATIPPGGSCGGCCTGCMQGSKCLGGYCQCPASGCTEDAWDAAVTSDFTSQTCPVSHFDPDCGPCDMELAIWCGANNKKCFCGNDYGCDATVAYSGGGTCPAGTVCVGPGGSSGYRALGAQCLPACKDECDPSQPPGCYGSALVQCVTGGACAKVQTAPCPSGKCEAGACQ